MTSWFLIQGHLKDQDRQQFQNWLRDMGNKLMSRKVGMSNWRTKQIKLLAIIGVITDTPKFTEEAIRGFDDYVAAALRPDGSSNDFHHRDALVYHVSGLRPLMNLALLLESLNVVEGRNFFDHEAPNGASIRKSVDFVTPYALGKKVHAEWVNTQVELDKQRAAAGIARYQPGKLYDPRHSVEMYDMATVFDSSYRKIVIHLTETDARYPTWNSVILDAIRP